MMNETHSLLIEFKNMLDEFLEKVAGFSLESPNKANFDRYAEKFSRVEEKARPYRDKMETQLRALHQSGFSVPDEWMKLAKPVASNGGRVVDTRKGSIVFFVKYDMEPLHELRSKVENRLKLGEPKDRTLKPVSWREVGLAPALVTLAEQLEKNGTETEDGWEMETYNLKAAIEKAGEKKPGEGRAPAQILRNYQAAHGKWIDKWITKKRGVLRLNKVPKVTQQTPSKKTAKTQ